MGTDGITAERQRGSKQGAVREESPAPNLAPRVRAVWAGATRAFRSAPGAMARREAAPYAAVDAFVRDGLLRELHAYPRRHLLAARLLWLATGIVGGHRYYLGHTGLGLLMTGTAGGCLVWWLVDGFRLRTLVERFNAEQTARERDERPPLGMDFVPRVTPDTLGALPPWHEPARATTARKLSGLFADALVLMFCAYVLGQVTLSAGTNAIVWAVGAVVVMINFADRLIPLYHLPLARGMVRWDYRLRLFYHFNRPGRFYSLLVRPVMAVFYAPFSEKCRAEVRLYSEIGGIFVAGSIVARLVSGELLRDVLAFDLGGFAEQWVENVVVSFVVIYAFAMPIGATLMKHVLLRRRNVVRWALSLLVVYYLLTGLEWL